MGCDDPRRIIAARREVRSCQLIGEGDYCAAYLVDEAVVFRFAKHAEAAASLRREACLLPRIAGRLDLRVPVPELLALDEDPAFLAYPFLPGPMLTKERYLGLAPADRDRCTAQVATFLTQLHATPLALVAACGIPPAPPPPSPADLTGRLAPPVLAFLERVIADEPPAVPPVLLHADLSPDHVLFDEATPSVTGIIDFGDVAIGDPARDLVYLHEDYGLDFLARVVGRYAPGEAGPLLRRLYRFEVVEALAWALHCVDEGDADVDDAIARLAGLEAAGCEPLGELLAAGAAIP